MEASFVVWVSANQLTGYTPVHAIGSVDVIVNNVNGKIATAPRAYTYVGPTITGINPNHGPMKGGTSVGINGSLFQNGAIVTFDGISATVVTFLQCELHCRDNPGGSCGKRSWPERQYHGT